MIMPSTIAKENMLRRIRQALSQPVPMPFPNSEGQQPVFSKSKEDDAVLFAENFTALQGKFVYCLNEEELVKQLSVLIQLKKWQHVFCSDQQLLPFLVSTGLSPFNDLAMCDAAITGCEYLVARTGSLVLSSNATDGRTASVYAPVHICIAYQHQLYYDLKEVLGFLKTKYKKDFPSLISFATGPSRTADIEKTLVTGVHGPKEVYCFLVES